MAVNIKNILVAVNAKFENMVETVITSEEEKIADDVIEMLEGFAFGYTEIDEILEIDEGNVSKLLRLSTTLNFDYNSVRYNLL